MTYDRILIPTDGSDPAEAAADHGFELAEQTEATVHVIGVADTALATSATYVSESSGIREQLRSQAESHVTALGDEARDRGIEVETSVREGIPAEEITDYADENGIDVIVIGTHGRGGFTRMVVGSVTDKVIRTSSVPVMTVRPSRQGDGDSNEEREEK